MASFTTKELNKLKEDIVAGGHKRSFSAHKNDVIKFVLAYFAKQAKTVSGNSSSSPNVEQKGPSDAKKKFSVKTVNGEKYTSSTTATATEPIAAARKVADKIKKKLSLDTFIFQIKEVNGALRTYKYTDGEVSSTTCDS